MIPPAMILCGGQATRLYPETETKPKALVEVLTKPFIWHQLHYLHKQGVTHVVLCTGKFSEQIKHYVGDGSNWGLEVRYSEDGDIPLGTGGAVKKALSLIPGNFILVNGDTWFPLDLARSYHYFNQSQFFARMYLYHGVNCGLYFFHKSIFKDCKKESFELWELLNHLIKHHEIALIETEIAFFDIGVNPEGKRVLEEYLWSISH
jgi:NDP-sugar pyrophosphorylase family protein